MVAPKATSTMHRIAMYQRVRRTRTLLRIVRMSGLGGLSHRSLIVFAFSVAVGLAEPVARPTHRLDQLDLERVVYFASQTPHVDVHHVGRALEIVTPNMRLDHLAGHE